MSTAKQALFDEMAKTCSECGAEIVPNQYHMCQECLNRVRGLNAFDFGLAVRLLKNGVRVARSGWNGKGMWLILVPAESWHTSVGPNASLVPNAHRLPFIAMKTVDDGLVPWLASQTDMLSEDWMIVE